MWALATLKALFLCRTLFNSWVKTPHRISPRNVIIYIIYHLDVLLYQVISTLPFTIYLNVICFSSCHKLIQEMNLHSLTCRFVDWSCERIIIVTACSSYSRSVVLHIKTGKPIKFYHTIHDLYKPDIGLRSPTAVLLIVVQQNERCLVLLLIAVSCL